MHLVTALAISGCGADTEACDTYPVRLRTPTFRTQTVSSPKDHKRCMWRLRSCSLRCAALLCRTAVMHMNDSPFLAHSATSTSTCVPRCEQIASIDERRKDARVALNARERSYGAHRSLQFERSSHPRCLRSAVGRHASPCMVGDVDEVAISLRNADQL